MKYLSCAIFVGALMTLATGAQAKTKICGIVNQTGSIAAGNRTVTGTVMEYNDKNIKSSMFNSCKQMRDKVISQYNSAGRPFTKQIDGANPPQLHRFDVLQDNNANSTCEPDKLMKQDDIYNFSWSQARDGMNPSSCWTVVRVK
jgi:hypothetical protein